MKIDVEHIAKLARLGLSPEEKKLFEEQLSAILDFAEKLKGLDTANAPPTAHAIPMKNILREDKVSPCENVADILANAPDAEGRMFRVPKIME